jgi:hypothetical protein
MAEAHISLSEALRADRLPDFIAQEEARGIGPAEDAPFLALLKKAAKAPQSADQASRSPCNDGSTGK